MAGFNTMISILIKILFFISIPLQVMLWPSVASICFSCVYGIIGIIGYFSLQPGTVWSSFVTPGIYLFVGETKKKNSIFTMLMAVYFTIYFILFISHEVSILPASTLWVDKSLQGNYSTHVYTPLPVDVTGDVSKKMRDEAFTWPKQIDIPAPLIKGVIPLLGPNKNDLSCSGGGGFKCFAKLWETKAAENSVFLPLSSQFYNVDVMVSPGQGKKCSDLEVYRVILDHNLNVIHPLDYPASAIASDTASRSTLYNVQCNLFGSGSNNTEPLCLQTQHTFTHAKYTQEITAKCDQFNQRLIFRLPERTSDVNQETGRHNLDLLLVSDSVASVDLHASWKTENRSDWFLFFSIWNQVVDSDALQSWRESTEGASVFFKFAIAVSPLAITWYYLSEDFIQTRPESQITFLTLFIQLPSILLFLSMGAWLPMAGCIICVLAVNHKVQKNSVWVGMVRPSLLFLTALCNSIQFAWILALVGQAGWNAFYYALTLDQLYDISFKFIITNQSSPTWIALMLPIILMVNCSFLVGAAICVVLESMAKSQSKK
jgi:hypothetical protein